MGETGVRYPIKTYKEKEAKEMVEMFQELQKPPHTVTMTDLSPVLCCSCCAHLGFPVPGALPCGVRASLISNYSRLEVLTLSLCEVHTPQHGTQHALITVLKHLR